jgi:peptidoglycan/xylan/chitin deacetylase (PgdA/CDA1 family)
MTGKAVITLVFDDNDPSIYTEAYTRMKLLNMVGTNACITGTVGNNGLYTLAQITEMYNYGWDICNHTNNHVQMTTETDPQIVTAVSGGRTYLINNGFTRSADILIAPSNETNEAILNVCKPYCTVATTRIDNGIDTANPIPFDPLRIRRRGVGSNDPTTVMKWIDEAVYKGQYLHLNFHKISNNGTALDYPPTDFQTVIDYIASLRNAGNLDVLTMSQLYTQYVTSHKRSITPIRTIPITFANCLSFDGSGDVVNIPYSSSLAFSGNQPITLASRHKTNSSATQRLWTAGTEIILRINGTTKEYEFILNSFTTNDRVVAGGVTPGAVQTAVGVYDGTDMLLYVDGFLVERVTPTGTYINPATTWKIGHDTTEQYAGKIYENHVINAAWSHEDILRWTFQGLLPSTGRKAGYVFNAGSGTTVTDLSGNANTGTIVGATWQAGM